ncbi:hypothetical protein LB543_22350 [Mesorhizobium sp. ESP7-2]|nr:hypothetical protein [Mesorhizobium sp. ESP7-2]
MVSSSQYRLPVIQLALAKIVPKLQMPDATKQGASRSPPHHRIEATMTKYQVEEIYGETVVSSGTVVENDPRKAAEATAGQRVLPRTRQDHWFRVVDEDQAAVYEYSLAGPDERPEDWTKLSDLGSPIVGHERESDAADEQDVYNCPICGQPVDMHDLRQAMWHEQPRHERLKPEVVKGP